MRKSFAGMLFAALIAAASTAPAGALMAAPAPDHALPAAPTAEKNGVVAAPSPSCIFDRWGNLRTSGPGACRLEASKQAACTKANGVVSTVNGALVCTTRQSGDR